MNLALFDFDGTITRKDSMLEFLKYAVGQKNYYLGLFRLSPGLLAYNIAKISVIGVGMKNHSGVAAKMFKVLCDEGINIKVIRL